MLDRFLGTKGRELEDEGDDERVKRGEQAAARRRDETYYSNIPGVLKRSVLPSPPELSAVGRSFSTAVDPSLGLDVLRKLASASDGGDGLTCERGVDVQVHQKLCATNLLPPHHKARGAERPDELDDRHFADCGHVGRPVAAARLATDEAGCAPLRPDPGSFFFFFMPLQTRVE